MEEAVMHFEIWKGSCAAFALTLAAGAMPAAAAVAYSEGWNGGNAAGWVANTTASLVSQNAVAGNPGGALVTHRDLNGPFFDIGALTTLPAATGNFQGTPWNVSFDLKLSEGTFTDASLRFRYLGPTQNGWRFDLGNSFATDNTFHTYNVTFDPSWSDVEASAHGWSREPLPSADFATTLGDVYTTEIRLTTTDSAATAYIDNFDLRPVPEPETYAMLVVGLLAVGAVTGKRAGKV